MTNIASYATLFAKKAPIILSIMLWVIVSLSLAYSTYSLFHVIGKLSSISENIADEEDNEEDNLLSTILSSEPSKLKTALQTILKTALINAIDRSQDQDPIKNKAPAIVDGLLKALPTAIKSIDKKAKKERE